MKKFLCVLLALAMTSTMFVAAVTTVSAGGTNIGKVEDGYTPVNGSIAVSTPEQFAAMESGKNYHLTADITIEKTWNAGKNVTANTGNTVFTGTFDGNGHTVTISAPMFAQIGGTVKNLTIKGSVETTLYAAAVAMYSKGTASFENIYNKANVSGAYASSLLAYGATGCIISVKNCLNEGTIVASANHAGGIICYVQDDKLTITNCVNVGAVSAKSGYAGGILARFGRDLASAPDSVVVIDKCENYGKVSSTTGQSGGIMGLFVGDATVTNCNNYGEIVNTNGMAAGIVGSHYNPKDSDDNEYTNHSGIVLNNCVNHGKVTGTTVVAGIIARHGRLAPNSNLYYRMTNCENHGDIYANIKSTKDTYYVGGLVGYAYGGTKYGDDLPNGVLNSINTGDIYVDASSSTVAHHVNGLLGYVNSNAFEIKNNINLGKIYLASALKSGSMISLTAYNKNATSTGTANNYSVDEFYIGGVKTTVSKAVIGSADTTDSKARIITEAQAESGELTHLVNQGAGKTVFYQNLREDAFPTVFAAEDGSNIIFKDEANNSYANPTANFTALNTLIAEANTYNEAAFVSGWAEFTAALEAARTVANNPIALQDAVDSAASTLDTAMKSLVTKKYAKIGDVEYVSLEEALKAAQAGETIVLVNDIVAENTIDISKSVTIDGNDKSISATGFNAISVTGSSLDVTIKNLTITSDKIGVSVSHLTSIDLKSKLTLNKVDITGGSKGVGLGQYWDADVDACTISGNVGFDCPVDANEENNGGYTITIDDSVITGNTSYAAYFRSDSTITVTNTVLTGKATKTSGNPNSAIQIKTSTADTQTTMTLNNCNVTSFGGYVVAINPYNKLYINGGNYTMTTPEGCVSRDALINVGDDHSYCKITEGTFTAYNLCAIRVFGPDSVLDIEGGTFIFDNPTSGGSALRTGANNLAGTANISGGHFISNAKESIINYIMSESVINVTGGTFENNGEHDIKVFAQTYSGEADTSRDILFPNGATKVVYQNGIFIDPDAEPEGPLVGDAIDMVLVLTVISAIAVGFTVTALVNKKRKEND